MKKLALLLTAILLITLGVGCAPKYATASELELLSEKQAALAEKSKQSSDLLTEKGADNEALYNLFNEITVEANALSTEISSFNGKKIEREDYERLMKDCDGLLERYKKLDTDLNKK